ncbi:hypothetical protein FH620_21320 [Corallococcus exiguus]|nr:hypothetical protein FH620_21320 [Corallococcus exiguus]
MTGHFPGNPSRFHLSDTQHQNNDCPGPPSAWESHALPSTLPPGPTPSPVKPRLRSARTTRRQALAPASYAPSLEALLGDLTPEAFLADHWEKRFYRLSRGQPDFYAPLLSQAGLDHLVASALALDPTAVELLRSDLPRNRMKDPTRAPDAQLLQAGYEAGSTLRVNAAHRFSTSIRDLCLSLEQRLSAPVNVNLYCSPARSQGVQAHFDRHDVLVLQVAGRKTWSLSPPPVDLPLEYVPPFRFENLEDAQRFRVTRHQPSQVDNSSPTQRFTLEPGDLLYLPRGHVHEARTDGGHSLHLTVGFKSITYADCLASAVFQRAHQEPRLRRGLPPGFASDSAAWDELRGEFRRLGEALFQSLDPDAAVSEVVEVLMRSRSRVSGLTLGSEEDAARVHVRSQVQRRFGPLMRYREGDGKATLQFGQRAVSVPADFGEALRFILRTPRFQVGELPGPLDDEGRVTLVRRLTHEGLFHIVSSNDG